MSASSARRAFEPVAIGLVELDHFGDQQRLAGDRSALPRRAHPFEHQPLVRGMLVDDDQPVLGLGDDVGRGDLAAGDAERDSSGPARPPARRGRRGLVEKALIFADASSLPRSGIPLLRTAGSPLSRG